MSRPVEMSLAALALAGLLLGGCSASDLYGERMDATTLDYGDAVNSNKIAQTVDPWPANSANTRLTYSGRTMKTAADRYYSGAILPPVATSTNTGANGATQSSSAAAPTVTQ